MISSLRPVVSGSCVILAGSAPAMQAAACSSSPPAAPLATKPASAPRVLGDDPPGRLVELVQPDHRHRRLVHRLQRLGAYLRPRRWPCWCRRRGSAVSPPAPCISSPGLPLPMSDPSHLKCPSYRFPPRGKCPSYPLPHSGEGPLLPSPLGGRSPHIPFPPRGKVRACPGPEPGWGCHTFGPSYAGTCICGSPERRRFRRRLYHRASALI